MLFKDIVIFRVILLEKKLHSINCEIWDLAKSSFYFILFMTELSQHSSLRYWQGSLKDIYLYIYIYIYMYLYLCVCVYKISFVHKLTYYRIQ